MTLLPIWLAVSAICSFPSALANFTVIVEGSTTTYTTIVSVVPGLPTLPPPPTTTTAGSTSTSLAPACDPANARDVFIVQPLGSTTFLEPTWNASVGGFEVVSAATEEEAMSFFYTANCDLSNPSEPFCGLLQLSFNWVCPEDNTTTIYRAWIQGDGTDGGPITFFDDAAQKGSSTWLRVITSGPAKACSLDLLAWMEHDLSNPFLVGKTLWMGTNFTDRIQLFTYPPLSS